MSEVGIPLDTEELQDLNELCDALHKVILRQRSARVRDHAYQKMGRLHAMARWCPDLVRVELLQYRISNQFNGIKEDIKSAHDKGRG